MRNQTGILLINLGTPKAPTPRALRAYLREFLSDPRVVEQPRWLWLPILHGIILNLRPRRSAAAYRRIWRKEGSPLLLTAQQQRERLAAALREHDCAVAIAMRYGEPSLAAGLAELRAQGCTRVIALPLYPQYSATTTASTFDALSAALARWRDIPDLVFISRYYDHPAYIEALATRIERYWAEHGRPDRLLCSFHGIPERYARAGDPYPEECRQTVRLLRSRLQLAESQIKLSFQSRFGREPWLQPYTDETLRAWGRQGLARADVVCPGFSADCLETLEEIAMENRDVFLTAGGGEYHYIPALNADDAHIACIKQIVSRYL